MDWLPIFLLADVVIIGMIFLLILLLLSITHLLRRANRTLIRIERLLKKLVVTVTVVSVKTDAASFDHGQTVNISGDVTVDGTPQASASVALKVTDSTGAEFGLPDATTGADGKFAAAWIIPPEVSPGACTVEATAQGQTATTTFTSNNHPIRTENQ